MRSATSLIYDLARSIPEAEVGIRDSIVEVPTLLIPHISLQKAQRVTESAFVGSEVQRTSFHFDFAQLRTSVDGLGTLSPIIATFAKGLWRIGILLQTLFDSTGGAVSDDAENVFVFLASPALPSSINVVLASNQSFAGAQTVNIERTFMFSDDAWILSFETHQPAASNYRTRVSVVVALLT